MDVSISNSLLGMVWFPEVMVRGLLHLESLKAWKEAATAREGRRRKARGLGSMVAAGRLDGGDVG
jgi:hypothetical protein